MFSHPNARGFRPRSFREWRSARRFREGIFLAALYPFGDASSRKEEEALLHTTLTDERFSTSLFQQQTGSRASAFQTSTTTTKKPVSGFQFHIEAKQNKVARTLLSQKERTYNKARKSEIATRIKKVRTLAEILLPAATEDNVAELEKLISEATKSVDKAVSKGVLHKNTGARRKSRMARCKQAVLKANNLMTYN